MNEVDELLLEHFGTKGMKWGVRNAPKNASKADKAKVDRRRSNVKKAAVILGSAAVVASLTVGAIYAKKHFNTSMKDLPKPKKHVTDFAKSISKEPVAIGHVSRGRMRGYMPLRGGGVKNISNEFIEAGYGDSKPPGWFKRYGKNSEKVAAVFADPLGRRDHAGRIVTHDIILPKSMAKDVNNADDVEKLVWPQIKDLFGAFYNSHSEDYGPGFS